MSRPVYQLFNLTRHPTISGINIYLEKNVFFLLDMMIWVWYYLKPKHSVIFLVFQWNKGISKKNSKKLVRGAIRLPITFLRLNTMLKGKKQRKVALIMKLAISNFRCPGETHITNFTRLPLQYILSCLIWVL